MIKYFNNKYIVFFVLIPFFKPICLQYYSALQKIDDFFVIWKIFSAIICFLLLVWYIWLWGKFPKILLLIISFEMSIVLSTLLNNGNIMRASIDAISIIAYTSFLTLSIKFNGRYIILLMSKWIMILFLVNLLSVLFFPLGLQTDLYGNNQNPLYFMTIDNGSALFLNFSLTVFVVDSLICYGRIRGIYKLLIVGVVFNALLIRSATAIVTVLLLVIATCVMLKSNLRKWQNPVVLFGIYVSVFFYLITMQNNYLSSFILEKVFHRSSDFTGRFFLWQSAIKMLKAKLWFGYGRTEKDYILAWGGYFSSHNYLLEILLQGGIIALGLFITIIVFTIKQTWFTRYNKITGSLIFSLMIILLAALMEATVHSVYIFGIICLCTGSFYLEKEQEKMQEWIEK